MNKVINTKIVRKMFVLALLVFGVWFVGFNNSTTQNVEAARCCRDCPGWDLLDPEPYCTNQCGSSSGTCFNRCVSQAESCYRTCTTSCSGGGTEHPCPQCPNGCYADNQTCV